MNLHTYYQGPFLSRVDKAQALAYPVAGFLVTLTDYLTFALFFSLFSTGLLESTVSAYIAGLVASYLLNRYWVFRKGASKQSESTSLWRYAFFLAVNLGITYLILWTLEYRLGISPYIGKFVVGVFMFFWVYLGNKYFVFRGVKTGPIEL